MMRAAPLHTEGAEFRQQGPVPHPIEETQRPLSEASLQEKDMSRRRASVERFLQRPSCPGHKDALCLLFTPR